MSRRKPIIALCYDFDGTLAPGNMQEYDFIPQLKLASKVFWKEVRERAKTHEADEILTYMCLMLEKATPSSGVKITREAFVTYGKTVTLFPGVSDWFDRINAFGKEQKATIEHYIISSGIKEMIEGTPISKKFRKIYASSFMYDQHGVAYWPAVAINYTTKTQFLFRINKGLLDVWDNSRINAFTPEVDRPIPFKRMIYFGDGTTDIPCMKLVKAQGGYSFAVYKPGSARSGAEKLMNEDRVNSVYPADYSPGSLLDQQVKAVIQKMVADFRVETGPTRRLSLEPEPVTAGEADS